MNAHTPASLAAGHVPGQRENAGAHKAPRARKTASATLDLDEGHARAIAQLSRSRHVWFLFMAAFVVPLALILVAAYANYRHAENEAFLRAQKTADALSEHALRTFRSHEHLVDIINGHLEHLRWQDIVQSPLLASMLRQLGQSEEDTNILLLDRSGQAISSKGGIYDSAALGRDYLRSLENG